MLESRVADISFGVVPVAAGLPIGVVLWFVDTLKIHKQWLIYSLAAKGLHDSSIGDERKTYGDQETSSHTHAR